MTRLKEPRLEEILAFCAEDPVERVFLEDVARRGLGRFTALENEGRVEALCHSGSNVVPSGQLSKWVIITEESHRLLRSVQFSDFMSESRKFTRKLLVISNNTGPFREVARVVVPPPLQQLLDQ